MARKFFVLGILAMASALGVFGYQALTYYFYGKWPAVSVHYVVSELSGSFPAPGWTWANELLQMTGKLPVAAVGIAICYLLLFASDALRRRDARQAS